MLMGMSEPAYYLAWPCPSHIKPGELLFGFFPDFNDQSRRFSVHAPLYAACVPSIVPGIARASIGVPAELPRYSRGVLVALERH